MEQLPSEIIFEILKRSKISDGYHFSLTNKMVHEIFVGNDSLWEHYLYSMADEEMIENIWIGDLKDTCKKCYMLTTLKKKLKLLRRIDELQNRKSFMLQNGNVSVIPKEFIALEKLVYLDLSYNIISSIPKELAQLENLEDLILENNRIKFIPKELSQLQQYHCFHCNCDNFRYDHRDNL